MARAVELAVAPGTEAVDEALSMAAITGRFAGDDLALVLDHLASAAAVGDMVVAERNILRPVRHRLLEGVRPVTTHPTAPQIPDALDQILRRMRLPYLRKTAPDVLATARAQRWDPAEVLRVLLNEEVVRRDAATRRMRRKTANFPADKTFSSWRPEESSIPSRR